jgi:hypothetical protein
VEGSHSAHTLSSGMRCCGVASAARISPKMGFAAGLRRSARRAPRGPEEAVVVVVGHVRGGALFTDGGGAGREQAITLEIVVHVEHRRAVGHLDVGAHHPIAVEERDEPQLAARGAVGAPDRPPIPGEARVDGGHAPGRCFRLGEGAGEHRVPLVVGDDSADDRGVGVGVDVDLPGPGGAAGAGPGVRLERGQPRAGGLGRLPRREVQDGLVAVRVAEEEALREERGVDAERGHGRERGGGVGREVEHGQAHEVFGRQGHGRRLVRVGRELPPALLRRRRRLAAPASRAGAHQAEPGLSHVHRFDAIQTHVPGRLRIERTRGLAAGRAACPGPRASGAGVHGGERVVGRRGRGCGGRRGARRGGGRRGARRGGGQRRARRRGDLVPQRGCARRERRGGEEDGELRFHRGGHRGAGHAAKIWSGHWARQTGAQTEIGLARIGGAAWRAGEPGDDPGRGRCDRRDRAGDRSRIGARLWRRLSAAGGALGSRDRDRRARRAKPRPRDQQERRRHRRRGPRGTRGYRRNTREDQRGRPRPSSPRASP